VSHDSHIERTGGTYDLSHNVPNLQNEMARRNHEVNKRVLLAHERRMDRAMSWQEIVRQLHELYKHGLYADEAVRLNARLLKIIGKNYCDLPASLIDTCLNVSL
jgi:hypothetical protein